LVRENFLRVKLSGQQLSCPRIPANDIQIALTTAFDSAGR
jgi:hypothetical protein